MLNRNKPEKEINQLCTSTIKSINTFYNNIVFMPKSSCLHGLMAILLLDIFLQCVDKMFQTHLTPMPSKDSVTLGNMTCNLSSSG